MSPRAILDPGTTVKIIRQPLRFELAKFQLDISDDGQFGTKRYVLGTILNDLAMIHKSQKDVHTCTTYDRKS